MTTQNPSRALQKARELAEYECDSDSAADFIQSQAENCDDCHLNEDGAWCKWHEAQYEKLISFPSLLSELEKVTKERDEASKLIDGAADSLNHVRNVAYSGDDHEIMNIAENGLKKLRPFLASSPHP